MVSFWESVAAINASINSFIWGVPMLILMVGTGIFFTVRCRFFQFRKFGFAMRHIGSQLFHRPRVRKGGTTTPFQAVSTALAATIGIGNIAGVAGAITLGGPGAIFWMWISAILGMMTKYAEVVLAIRYRERNCKGEWVGGPMYYITHGLGHRFQWLASTFAMLGALAAFGIGNMTQINTVSTSIVDLVEALAGTSIMPASSALLVKLIVGMTSAVFVGLIMIGGVSRIGRVTERLVPFMSILYIIGSLAIIITHIDSLGSVFSAVLKSAFQVEAVSGGVLGFTITQAMSRGISRGIFSNEAGMGSAPIAHASADTSSPTEQGLYGIFEVFLDTMVMCTISGLVILISGIEIPYGETAGISLITSAFATLMRPTLANMFITVSVLLFAVCTIIGWSLYGIRCIEYLFGNKAVLPYQIVFLLLIIVGAIMEQSLAWDIAETLNGLMAIPNLIALIGLSGTVVALTQKYEQQLKLYSYKKHRKI